MYFVIDKLSTDMIQTVSYYINRLMTKGVIIVINSNSLVEFEMILLLCGGVIFCVISEIFSKLY